MISYNEFVKEEKSYMYESPLLFQF